MVRKTLISTARSCMDKVGASESDLEHLRKDPPYPEKAACIIKCLLEKVHQISSFVDLFLFFLGACTILNMSSKIYKWRYYYNYGNAYNKLR